MNIVQKYLRTSTPHHEVIFDSDPLPILTLYIVQPSFIKINVHHNKCDSYTRNSKSFAYETEMIMYSFSCFGCWIWNKQNNDALNFFLTTNSKYTDKPFIYTTSVIKDKNYFFLFRKNIQNFFTDEKNNF